MTIRRFTLFVVLVLASAVAWAASLSLAWDPVSSESVVGYRIYWGTEAGSYTQQADAGSAASWTVDGLAEAATYYFAVTAYDLAGAQSGYSNEVSQTIGIATPVADFTIGAMSNAAPRVLTFTNTSTGVVSSYAWTFGDGSTSVERDPAKTFASPGVYSIVLTVTGPGGSSTRTALVSVPPLADTVAPTAPTSLVAVASGPTVIRLAWPAATDDVGVDTYHIEHCTDSKCTVFATTADITYTSRGLAADTTHRYRVRAADAAGNLGPYSPAATVTTPSPESRGTRPPQ